MKYVAPYGSADPNAAYVDRNTPGAVSGSRVPAAAIEHPQREIAAVIAAGGLTGSSADLTQLLQAIQNLIDAATGGGGDENFVLMTQARARLPIFPEILTADGLIPVISPSSGQIRVPAGYEFLHRGIFHVTSVQSDFATVASKTYHLRWTPSSGFALKDLSSGAYNPSALQESNTVFDTTFDDMLVARVVTNSSNVPTIVNLVNKDRWSLSGETEIISNNPYEDDKKPSQITGGTSVALNLARKPRAAVSAMSDVDGAVSGTLEFNLGVKVDSRYSIKTFYQYTGETPRAAAFSYEVWF